MTLTEAGIKEGDHIGRHQVIRRELGGKKSRRRTRRTVGNVHRRAKEGGDGSTAEQSIASLS